MSLKYLQEIYKEKTISLFQERFGKGSVLSIPRIEKVVVNMGIGRISDSKEREEILQSLAKITGQKPYPRPARIAIASFKTRKGAIVGYTITLRGKRMYDFLERLIFVAIPRTRDFRGIPLAALDEHGNLHIGIREHIVFPELISEDVRKIYSLQVTVVTSTKSREKAEILFRSLGFPLAKSS